MCRVNTSGTTEPSGYLTCHTPVNDYQTANKVYVDNAIAEAQLGSGFKTLFGNQSIVGNGNIDIYEHDIVISGDLTEVLLTVYSSKNVTVDSLTDLKTLCGNTFKKSCTGRANSKVVYGITEANLLFADGTTSTLANLTFTDTVTTI